MLERRKAERTQTCLSGSISYVIGPHVDCVIRNLSGSGACLVFARRSLPFPTDFSLDFDSKLPRRTCRLVWRSGFLIGVRFLGSGGLDQYYSLEPVDWLGWRPRNLH